VEVVLSELSWDPLASHVFAGMFPRDVPPCADGFERVNARIRPLAGFTSCNEPCTSLFLSLVLVGLRSWL